MPVDSPSRRRPLLREAEIPPRYLCLCLGPRDLSHTTNRLQDLFGLRNLLPVCLSKKNAAQSLPKLLARMSADPSHSMPQKIKPAPGLPHPLKWTPERELKRRLILELIKRGEDYQRMSEVYDTGAEVDLKPRPVTPKNIPSTSKRLWERQIVQWKSELKAFAQELETTSNTCSSSSPQLVPASSPELAGTAVYQNSTHQKKETLHD